MADRDDAAEVAAAAGIPEDDDFPNKIGPEDAAAAGTGFSTLGVAAAAVAGAAPDENKTGPSFLTGSGNPATAPESGFATRFTVGCGADATGMSGISIGGVSSAILNGCGLELS